jgi:hypothetical protein
MITLILGLMMIFTASKCRRVLTSISNFKLSSEFVSFYIFLEIVDFMVVNFTLQYGSVVL